MSQEIQLVPQPQPLPLQPMIAPQVLAPTVGAEATPLRRIHRLLRGRYVLAGVLAAIGAAFGVAAGVLLPKPAYESAGVIQIRPIIPTPGDMDRVMPLYNQYMADVMVKLHTERVIKEAMQSPEWKQRRPYAGDYPPADQVNEFSKNLTVKQMPNAPEMIQVTFDDSRPDARDVTQTAVQQTIKAYMVVYSPKDADDVQRRKAYFDNERAQLEAEISLDRKSVEDFSQEVGDDVTPLVEARERNLMGIENNLKEARKMLKMTEDDVNRHRLGQPTGNGSSPEDIARVDTQMAARLNARNDVQIRIRELEVTYEGGHPLLKQARQLLALREDAIREAAEHFNEIYFIQARQDGTLVPVPKDVTRLKELVNSLEQEWKTEDAHIRQIQQRHAKILSLRDEISRKQARVTELERMIRDLEFQKAMGGTLTIIDEGGLPIQAGDRRPVMAALGFLGGAALPVGMLLLIGLANPRYRFSDETGPEMNGLNLLGILPDLPDRLSDPEQASIAAHCVHQIRTMLQISGGPEERRVFAVTSAAPGDGKTSLTLALGLSYAACGTRTLLIDCDLIGAGLSARMNVNTPDGVLEAIANRSLMEYVRATDVADVSILPVGSAQTLHASTLSPAALRRLIDEARKQFDTILIDTGPVLGSIEASLVCAAADAVVLTVARGQQRPLVEKAISHLMGINAKLAGVVFNRAQSADFDRSISGVSLRSVSAGTGHNGSDGPRFGALGRAVHSHAGQTDDNEG